MQEPETAPRPSHSPSPLDPARPILGSHRAGDGQPPVAFPAREVWGHNILRRPGDGDFGPFDLDAWMGIHRGWNTRYDVAVPKPI
jgi:hypothetical protein